MTISAKGLESGVIGTLHVAGPWAQHPARFTLWVRSSFLTRIHRVSDHSVSLSQAAVS
jgi:hypothetical protein